MRTHYGSTSHQDARALRNAVFLGCWIGFLGWVAALIFL